MRCVAQTLFPIEGAAGPAAGGALLAHAFALLSKSEHVARHHDVPGSQGHEPSI